MKKEEINEISIDKYDEKSWEPLITFFWNRYNKRYFFPIKILQDHDDFEIRNNCGFLIATIDCILIETLEQYYSGQDESTGKNHDPFYSFFKRSEAFKGVIQSDKDAGKFASLVRSGLLHQSKTKKASVINKRKSTPIIGWIDSSDKSKGFLDFQGWKNKSKQQKLSTSECIATWTDVCGFGSLLEKNEWDLNKLQNDRILELLNEVYTIAGRVFLPNVAPLPSDKVLVLNDGIAKTVDLHYKSYLDGYIFLFFLRDTIINHHILLDITQRFNVGIRTILAGGQRIQYSPDKMTGQSMLYYDENNISEHGKKILNTQFSYNPPEFQMNTAFAKAFTIDTLGTSENIVINGLFIEEKFIELISDIPNLKIENSKNAINIYLKGTLMFKLLINNQIEKVIKGLDTIIFQIDKLIIYKEFDGDDLEFELFKERKKSS